MRDILEQSILSVSYKFTIGGSVSSIVAGVSGKLSEKLISNPDTVERAVDWSTSGVQFGMFVGLTGIIIQLYFGIRRDIREQKDDERNEELHRKRLEAFNRGRGGDNAEDE